MYDILGERDSLSDTRTHSERIITILCWISWSFVVFFEICQALGNEKKCYYYFCDIWNFFDTINLLLCFVLNVIILTDSDVFNLKVLRLLAAILSITLMLKFGDWLRIFKSTGFFIELLWQTIIDVYPFMILMLFGFLTFGFAIMFLELNLTEKETDGFWYNMGAEVLY